MFREKQGMSVIAGVLLAIIVAGLWPGGRLRPASGVILVGVFPRPGKVDFE